MQILIILAIPILEWNKFYVFSFYISVHVKQISLLVSRGAHRTGDSGAQSAAKALRVKNFEAKMGKIADFDYSANNTFKSKDPNKTKNISLKL